MVTQKVLHYQLLEKIGAGGMGEIYKAQDSRLNRLVAVKILSPNLSADPDRRRRFFQEAQAASALNHPNIITLYDIISEDDLQCIVMEYVAGKTLRELIPRGGMPPLQALQLGAQIASALAAAHSAGIIHRDLKPSNIMVTSTGLVKVLDFGLAKWVGVGYAGPSLDQGTAETTLTREGSIIGTVSYMSPEQAEGKHVDARSDIFSYGDVLYEMVTGKRAFEGRSGISTLSSILRDNVRPVYESAPDVPPMLEQIIARCLPKDPAARWQSMKEIEAALTALLRQLDPAGQYAPPVPIPSVVSPPIIPAIHTDQLSPISNSREEVSKEGSAEGRFSVAPVFHEPAAAISSPSGDVAAQAKSPKAAAGAARSTRTTRFILILLFLIGTVLVASAGIGAWWWWSRSGQAGPSVASSTAPQQSAPISNVNPSSPGAPPAAASTVPPPGTSAPGTSAPVVAVPQPEHRKTLHRRKLKPTIAAPPPLPSVASTSPPTVFPAPVLPPPPKAPQRPPAAVATIPISVADGSPFQVVLSNDVPSDEPEGFALTFTVTQDLKVGDKTVIAKGATVSGSVAGQASKKGFLGLGGGRRMMFRLNQVTAVDGKKLSVRALPTRTEAGIAISPLEGKGPRVKGYAAVQGTPYLAYIDGDQIVAVPKIAPVRTN